MRRRSRNKNNVSDYEFRDGYALVFEEELDAVIEAYRWGHFKKNELRVYAGLCEQQRQHKNAKASLYRIVNRATKQKGEKRLSHKEIEDALDKVETLRTQFTNGRRRAVATKFLRYMARGSGSAAETVLLLYYCKRRLKQTHRLLQLNPKERYARFKYRDVAEVAGLRRATLCDAMKRLSARGLLAVVAAPKQNENAFGMIYVDGRQVSLTRATQENSINKTVTGGKENRNALLQKSATLINGNLRTVKITSSIRMEQLQKWERLARDPNEAIASIAARQLINFSLSGCVA